MWYLIVYIICVRIGQKNLSLGITVCHHSASLVMPNGNPLDGCFHPILKLMIYFLCSAQLQRLNSECYSAWKKFDYYTFKKVPIRLRGCCWPVSKYVIGITYLYFFSCFCCFHNGIVSIHHECGGRINNICPGDHCLASIGFFYPTLTRKRFFSCSLRGAFICNENSPVYPKILYLLTS